MKKSILVILFLIFGSNIMAKNMWVFFDLGNTVINVKDKESFKYFKGSQDYIYSLKEMGFKVGLISNIPESFGKNYEEKFKTLKKYVRNRWKDDLEFDWTIFDKVYLPLSDKELKPSPILFKRALRENDIKHSLFISETKAEVDKAIELGFAGHHFKDDDALLYLPLVDVEPYIKRFSRPNLIN